MTAPESTTWRICDEVPEVIFAKAHAASNWRFGCSILSREVTKCWTRLDCMTSSIGGLISSESIWQMDWTILCMTWAKVMRTAGVKRIAFNAQLLTFLNMSDSSVKRQEKTEILLVKFFIETLMQRVYCSCAHIFLWGSEL